MKKKVSARGGTRCHDHLGSAADHSRRERSRSPVRLRRCDAVAPPRWTPRMTELLGDLLFGLRMMKKAIDAFEAATMFTEC